jgi:hypothetical protein
MTFDRVWVRTVVSAASDAQIAVQACERRGSKPQVDEKWADRLPPKLHEEGSESYYLGKLRTLYSMMNPAEAAILSYALPEVVLTALGQAPALTTVIDANTAVSTYRRLLVEKHELEIEAGRMFQQYSRAYHDHLKPLLEAGAPVEASEDAIQRFNVAAQEAWPTIPPSLLAGVVPDYVSRVRLLLDQYEGVRRLERHSSIIEELVLPSIPEYVAIRKQVTELEHYLKTDALESDAEIEMSKLAAVTVKTDEELYQEIIRLMVEIEPKMEVLPGTETIRSESRTVTTGTSASDGFAESGSGFVRISRSESAHSTSTTESRIEVPRHDANTYVVRITAEQSGPKYEISPAEFPGVVDKLLKIVRNYEALRWNYATSGYTHALQSWIEGSVLDIHAYKPGTYRYPLDAKMPLISLRSGLKALEPFLSKEQRKKIDTEPADGPLPKVRSVEETLQIATSAHLSRVSRALAGEALDSKLREPTQTKPEEIASTIDAMTRQSAVDDLRAITSTTKVEELQPIERTMQRVLATRTQLNRMSQDVTYELLTGLAHVAKQLRRDEVALKSQALLSYVVGVARSTLETLEGTKSAFVGTAHRLENLARELLEERERAGLKPDEARARWSTLMAAANILSVGNDRAFAEHLRARLGEIERAGISGRKARNQLRELWMQVEIR